MEFAWTEEQAAFRREVIRFADFTSPWSGAGHYLPLLRDDALIHRVNVETDRLLKDAPPNALVVIVNVKVVITRPTLKTMLFITD